MTEHAQYEEIIQREVAEPSLEDLNPLPGVSEAVLLYEAAVERYVVAASTYLPDVSEIVSSSNTT